MIRVLLADDQALVRAGFRALLDAQADITVVAEAGDGAEALAAVEREHPDVVLMARFLTCQGKTDAVTRRTGRGSAPADRLGAASSPPASSA